MNLSNYQNPYVVADASASSRATFLRRTYLHLAGAIAAFAGLEALLINSSFGIALAEKMLAGSWLLVLGAFMLVSWIADRWASSSTSKGMQYLGLGLFIVAEAIIFLPLLIIAVYKSSPQVLPMAVMVTALLFAGLTTVAFTSGADFSFLRGALTIGGFVALGLIACSLIFGFQLGLIFSGAMVIFAGAAILYNTSNIMRQYNEEQYVSASLALFSSVALLFWYVLRIFMSRD
jgi:FtsH-binding integral membrane protein